MWLAGERCQHVAAHAVERVVARRARGDASVGALAAGLVLGLDLGRAVAEGMRAGAVAVQGEGATASYGAIEPISV